jgi:predicted GH43/DUF377 family glycosyl hydrolase
VLSRLLSFWHNLAICKDRLLSAASADGVAWQRDPGARIDVRRPPDFDDEMVYGCWVGQAGSQYEMIYQGSRIEGGEWHSRLRRRSSTNGLTWGPPEDTGLCKGAHPLCALRVQSPFLLTLADTPKLFFAGTGKDGISRILSASRSGPTGWRIADEPVLSPSNINRPDNRKVIGLCDPSITPDGRGGYRMYFSASLEDEFSQEIMSARSSDAGVWSFDKGSRITASSPGFGQVANNPTVLFERGEYRMWFRGSDMMPLWSNIYWARSRDGLAWEVMGSSLPYGRFRRHERHGVGFPYVLRTDRGYRMYYAGYWGNLRCGTTVDYYKHLHSTRKMATTVTAR